MKLLIEIKDTQAPVFLETLRAFKYVKTETLSAQDAALLTEIREIKKAFKNAGKIKTGQLKGRPVAELLNEL